MKTRLNQKGFATWELALGVLVVAVIAFTGYYVYNANNSTSSSKTATAKSKSSINTPKPPSVSSTSDLDKASAALNQVDPSGSNTSDNTQLSSQSNF